MKLPRPAAATDGWWRGSAAGRAWLQRRAKKGGARRNGNGLLLPSSLKRGDAAFVGERSVWCVWTLPAGLSPLRVAKATRFCSAW